MEQILSALFGYMLCQIINFIKGARMRKSKVDKYIKLIVNKVAYNRNINTQIKPFKQELIGNYFDDELGQFQVSGSIGEIQLQKVVRPYVDLEKLKVNSRDYKKYVTYKESYRLTAKEMEVA